MSTTPTLAVLPEVVNQELPVNPVNLVKLPRADSNLVKPLADAPLPLLLELLLLLVELKLLLSRGPPLLLLP
jgi:hypothetical protein